jgi:hypothetical protein
MVRHDRPLLVAYYERCDELNLRRCYDAASFEKVIYLRMLNLDEEMEVLVICINWCPEIQRLDADDEQFEND